MFQGAFTALVTPFRKDGAIDEESLRRLVNFQIDEGIAGIVPMGTTGESPTVSHDENIDVIRIVVEETRGRVPVIAGTGSNSTSEAVDMTRRAKEIGADATLQVAPYYNKPNQEGLYQHFTKVADEGGLPVIVYNIPGRTGRNIDTSTIIRLAEHPGIQAVKEAAGSLPQFMDTIAGVPDDFDVLSGDDNFALPVTLMGARGVISVASNLLPGRMQRLIEAGIEGRTEEAVTEHYRLLPFFRALFIDTNPIPIKYAMARAGHLTESYRLPLTPLSPELRKQVDAVLSDLGI
ncbi:MAG: 4-hydroxy-tetrahydrodipicolinate synthase [Spirochaetota bacterium]